MLDSAAARRTSSTVSSAPIVDVRRHLEDRDAAPRQAAGGGGVAHPAARAHLDLSDEIIEQASTDCPPNTHAEDWDLDALAEAAPRAFNFKLELDASCSTREALTEKLWGRSRPDRSAQSRARPAASSSSRAHFYLEEIDAQWIDHLKAMDSCARASACAATARRIRRRVQEGRLRHVPPDDGRISANVVVQAVPRAARAAAAGGAGRAAAGRNKTPSSRSSSTRSAAWWPSTLGVEYGRGTEQSGGRAGKTEDRAGATNRRSAGTSHVLAVAAKSTRSATALPRSPTHSPDQIS